MSSVVVSLQPFFQPRHVAVIGASASPGKLGHAVFRHLVQRGFPGRLSPVNARGDSVLGVPGYRSIADVPDRVDVAFLAIPATQVVPAAEACIEAGVKALIVGASGFAELGTAEGEQRQAQLRALAQAHDVRILGPNTNGLLNVHDRLALGYNAAHGAEYDPGPISIISHSGALFDSVAKRIHQLGGGISKFVAVGNEVDVSMLDVLEAMVDDPTTEVVGLVVEALSDTSRLRTIAQRLAAANKRVVALKVGRSQAGASATLAHSSRLAGSARAVQSVLTACGFASVGTIEALAGSCTLLALGNGTELAEPVLGVSTSGAGGALLMDLASERQIPVAPAWPEELDRALQALPVSARVRQPIDMGNFPDWSTLNEVLEAVEAHGYRGPTVTFAHVGAAPGMDAALAAALTARRQRLSVLTLVVSPGGLLPEVEACYRSAGIPVFHDMATAFDSLRCCYANGTPYATIGLAQAQQVAAAEGRRVSAVGVARAWSEDASAQFLRAAGVPMVASHRLGADIEAVCAAAAEVGYPVVLKAMAPGVAHKHAAGLVAVDLRDDAALREAWQTQFARVQAMSLEADTQWLVQPLLRAELELLLGLTWEPGLGYFLVCGMGGVHAESFREVAMFPVPSATADMRRGLQGGLLGSVLASVAPDGSALERVVGVLAALQEVLSRAEVIVHSIDINPLLVSRDQVVAVDALVVAE